MKADDQELGERVKGAVARRVGAEVAPGWEQIMARLKAGGSPSEPARPPASPGATGRTRRRRLLVSAVAAAVVVTVAVWGLPAAKDLFSDPGLGITATGGPNASSRGGAPANDPRLERVFIRTTADGVTIRGYQGQGSGGRRCSGGGVAGTPTSMVCTELLPRAHLSLEVSNADAADDFSGATNRPPSEAVTTPTLAIEVSAVAGVAEGSPMSVVGVRTGAEVSRVRVRFDDGAMDEVIPVKGWAGLGHQGNGLGGTVEALDSAGAVIAQARTDALPPTGSSSNPAPLERLVVRTTTDGLVLRAYLGPDRPASALPPPRPVGACDKPQVRIEVSNDLAATRGNPTQFDELSGTISAVGRTSLGYLEGAPGFAVAVRAAPEVGRVQLSVADRVVDATSPVGGWAVLGASGTIQPTGTLEAFDSTGRALASVPLEATFGSPSPPPPTVRALFTRTTADGIAIRAQQVTSTVSVVVSGCGNLPRSESQSVVRAGLSNSAAVVFVEGPRSGPGGTSPGGGGALRLGSPTTFGEREGTPASAVVVLVPPGTTLVRARFADGDVDQMAPVEGVAVLAHDGAEATGTVEAIDQAGRVIASEQFPRGGSVGPAPPALRPLFRRRTGDGVDIRAYATSGPTASGAPVTLVLGEMSTDTDVWIVYGREPEASSAAITLASADPPKGTSTGLGGILVRARPDVAKVRARYADGRTDEMVPVEGWALLARSGPTDGATVEAFDASGRLIGSVPA